MIHDCDKNRLRGKSENSIPLVSLFRKRFDSSADFQRERKKERREGTNYPDLR